MRTHWSNEKEGLDFRWNGSIEEGVIPPTTHLVRALALSIRLVIYTASSHFLKDLQPLISLSNAIYPMRIIPYDVALNDKKSSESHIYKLNWSYQFTLHHLPHHMKLSHWGIIVLTYEFD